MLLQLLKPLFHILDGFHGLHGCAHVLLLGQLLATTIKCQRLIWLKICLFRYFVVNYDHSVFNRLLNF